MMFGFVILAAAGQVKQIINALPKSTVKESHGHFYTCEFVRNEAPILYYLRQFDTVSISTQSTAENGRFSVFSLMPLSVDQRDGLRLYRAFSRAVASPQNTVNGKQYLAGPFTVEQMQKTYPAFYNKHFVIGGQPRFPHVLFGSDPVSIAAYKYNPTVNDINNDVDVDF